MDAISKVRLTKKDELWNQIVMWMEDKGCAVRRDLLDTTGKRIVSNLTDALWYASSYHNMFRERGFPIPQTDVFTLFAKSKDAQNFKAKKMKVRQQLLVCMAWQIDWLAHAGASALCRNSAKPL